MAEVEKLDELFPSRSTVKAHRRRNSKTSGHSGHSGRRSRTPLDSSSTYSQPLSTKTSIDVPKSRGFLGLGSKRPKHIGYKPGDDETLDMKLSTEMGRNKTSSSTQRQAYLTPLSPAPPTVNTTGLQKERVTSDSWDPPPLFQAYPQSVKYSSLQASSLEADSILRYDDIKRRQKDLDLALSQDFAQQYSKKEKKALKKHSRKPSGSLSKSGWLTKVYVLVTSGYLLQYAGDGPYDRLPEKILTLGGESVAFVSDAIPGQCFVLQVSDQANEEGLVPVEEAKSSFRAKISLKKGGSCKTHSMLLIFDNSQDMELWMKAIRKAIESLGSSRYTVPDVATIEAEAEMLKSKPSRRYLIKQDPNLFSDSPLSDTLGTPATVDLPEFLSISPSSLRGTTLRPGSETPSFSNSTVASQDQARLDQLRDSSRFSYLSSGSMTMPTSRCSSTASSPQIEISLSKDSDAVGLDQKAAPTATLAERRRTMNLTLGNSSKDGSHSPLSLQLFPKPPQRPHSTFGFPDQPHAISPATPNFSLPNPNNRISICHAPSSIPLHRQRSYQSGDTDFSSEATSRPTSTVGDLPMREDLSRHKYSRFRDDALPESVSEPEHPHKTESRPVSPSESSASSLSMSPQILQRSMSPEAFYPSKLADVQSLSPPPPTILETTETPTHKKRRSRSSSAADRRPWQYILSSGSETIILDPAPKRQPPKANSRPASRNNSGDSSIYKSSLSGSRPTSPYSVHSPAPFISVEDLSCTLSSLPASPPPYSPIHTSRPPFTLPAPTAPPTSPPPSRPTVITGSSPIRRSKRASDQPPSIPLRSPRRPTSMQVFARPVPSVEQKVLLRSGSSMGFNPIFPQPPAGGTAAVAARFESKGISRKNRQSGAILMAMAGPPPAPPPTCPLPALPPGAEPPKANAVS
ncbi:MAG: hypothetical protein M1814_003680 [Vezdaea aestivalis]|nr:MAG: hypothetical protein M1814_003680 [Vezdaea aestivalis]